MKPKTIGLVPGSFKPYHIGHDSLVRLAASENDEVHLFVSTSDRIKRGEFPLHGADMERIWKEFLEPTLPSNVVIKYGGSPVHHVYSELEAANSLDDNVTIFRIYSDKEDVLKYSPDKLAKYAPLLFDRGQIELRGVDRNSTVPVSGTEMRKYLQRGTSEDREKFIELLPPSVRDRGDKIYDILSHKISENLLKKYIKLLIF
jgi:cytidyltransferase-like protein